MVGKYSGSLSRNSFIPLEFCKIRRKSPACLNLKSSRDYEGEITSHTLLIVQVDLISDDGNVQTVDLLISDRVGV